MMRKSKTLEELAKRLKLHLAEWQEKREANGKETAGSGKGKAKEFRAATANYRSTVPDKALTLLWSRGHMGSDQGERRSL